MFHSGILTLVPWAAETANPELSSSALDLKALAGIAPKAVANGKPGYINNEAFKRKGRRLLRVPEE